jgi:penicillin-binding protein-related factor A (putative recombinase)
MQEETAFKIKIMKKLRSLEGIWFVKTQQVAIRGTPDILGCFRGRFFAIELKRDLTSKISELQRYNLKMIKKAGGLGFVWCPENYEEYLEQFFINPSSSKGRKRNTYHRTEETTPSKKIYNKSDLY